MTSRGIGGSALPGRRHAPTTELSSKGDAKNEKVDALSRTQQSTSNVSQPKAEGLKKTRSASFDGEDAEKHDIHGADGAKQRRLAETENVFFKVKVISLASKPATVKNEQMKATDTSPKSYPPEVYPNVLANLEFKAANAESFRTDTTLKHLRVKLQDVLPNTASYKFCAEDCSVVQDDLNLNTYFTHLVMPPTAEHTEFAVFTRPYNGPNLTGSTVLDRPPFLLRFIRMQGETGQIKVEGSLHSSAFEGNQAAQVGMLQVRDLIKAMSGDPQQDVFCLRDGTPVEDGLLLRQYLSMMNEELDRTEQVPSISVCFRRSRSGKFETPKATWGAASPGDQATALERPDISFKDRSEHELRRDKTGFQIQETLNAQDFAAKEANPTKFTSNMDEHEWDSVLRNCNVLYGWRFDMKVNKVVRAPHPAFRLRRGLNMHQASKIIDNIGTTATILENKQNQPDANSTDVQVLKLGESKDLKQHSPEKPWALPSFAINDRSKIDIATVQHEFQRSMAENHFTADSFEASVSGSYGVVSAGVSGDVGTEKENAKSQSEKTFTKTMVASYKFPRVTIYLPPEDLEPTDELKEAIELVRDTKNLHNLRKLHRTFGHLFCHEVVLGGCLQTLKVVLGKEKASEQMEREKFKASVGVSVSIPGGPGASFKASHEKQDQKESGDKTTDTSETLSFDATGGNTILAADPPAWSASVANYEYWRVIDQCQLTPLADAICQIQGYADIKMWFLQAVPKLSEYIVIPDSRMLDVRFKVMFDLEGLKRIPGLVGEKQIKSEHEDEGLSKSERFRIQTYLGHNPQKPAQPVRVDLQTTTDWETIKSDMKMEKMQMKIDMTKHTYQITNTTKDSVFYPASTQSPALLQPKGKEVGTHSDATRKMTVWRLEVPSGYSLAHNTLVSIKSLAVDNPKLENENRQPLALTVYRNGQGVFLPAITNSEEQCFWRVLKRDAKPLAADQNIKDGDVIRLCWCFSDQTSGFRDYKDDVYGRRRYNRPEDVKVDTLFPKVPYPRFENADADTGVSLVMSAKDSLDPVIDTLTLIDKSKDEGEMQVNYNMFDLSFRLDAVGNNGNGEVFDYMNVVAEDQIKTFEKKLISTDKWSENQSAGDVFDHVADGAKNLLEKGVDGIVNSVMDGSAISVAANVVKFAATRLNPIGALCSFFW